MKNLVAFLTLSLCLGATLDTARAQSRVDPGPAGPSHILWGDFEVTNDVPNLAMPQSFRIYLKSLGGQILHQTTLTAKARYSFRGVPNGDYLMTVEVESREVVRTTLRIDEFKSTDIRRDLAFVWKAPPGTGTLPVPASMTTFAREGSIQSIFDQALVESGNANLKEAGRLLEQVIAGNSDDYEAWTELGNVHFRDQKPRDAARCYKKALEAKPDFLVAILNLGKLQVSEKDYGAAIETLTRAVEIDTNLADAYFFLGEAQLQSKQGSNAIKSFTKSLELKPVEMADAHLRMGSLYQAAGYMSHAVTEYEHFIEKRPDAPQRKKLEDFITANKKP